jgi:glycosyltransferase involved in cell wall biosynthesis
MATQTGAQRHVKVPVAREFFPLRVLMVAPTSFFSHYGGHIRILEEARALQDLGNQVAITTYYKGFDVPGIDIRRTAPLPWHTDYEVGSSRHKLVFDLYLLGTVLRQGYRYRPHIVHGHMHEGALIGGLLARLLRVPLVFDFQGSLSGEMLDHGFIRANGAGYRMWRRLESFITGLPQAILTSSEEAKRFLGDEFGVSHARIVPLPDCADLSHFAPDRFSDTENETLRRQLGIPTGRPVVAYLGLLADYQGTDHLLRAAAYLKERSVDVHFLVMGYPNVDHYFEMARNLSIGDHVTLTGRIDYLSQAPQYLALGDVAVSPKMSATEGSGKVLNYMAMGQPVVAYDSPVHREYLGKWGVYVPSGEVVSFAEAIRALIGDEPRRRELGEQLRRRATRLYNWQSAARRVDSVYRQLIRQNSVRIGQSV